MPRCAVTVEEARAIAAEIGIDWDEEIFDLDQFRAALHGAHAGDLEGQAPLDDPVRFGMLALQRLREGRFSDGPA